MRRRSPPGAKSGKHAAPRVRFTASGKRVEEYQSPDVRECTFRPALCNQSRSLDNKNKKGLQIAAEQSDAATGAELKREDMILLKHEMAKHKLEMKREIKAEEEMAACTFQPEITEYTGGPMTDPSDGVFNKLHFGVQPAIVRGRIAASRGETKTSLEKEVEERCTFQPQVFRYVRERRV